MKNSLLAFALLGCCAAWGVGISVELDGRNNKITLAHPVSATGLLMRNTIKDPAQQKHGVEFYEKESGSQWKQYEFSFVPNKQDKTITLTLWNDRHSPKGKVEWVDVDAIEVTNGALNNRSFEQMSVKNDIYCWRYYTKASEKLNQSDAADGKNYVSVSRKFPVRQTLRVITPGKPVIVRFRARKGKVTPEPTDKHWASDQNARQAISMEIEI